MTQGRQDDDIISSFFMRVYKNISTAFVYAISGHVLLDDGEISYSQQSLVVYPSHPVTTLTLSNPSHYR